MIVKGHTWKQLLFTHSLAASAVNLSKVESTAVSDIL